MYRRFRTLPWIAACALALIVGCNRSPSAPTAAGAEGAVSGEAAADGSTLKVVAPTLTSPVNDERLDTRQPTLVLRNAVGRFVNRAFSYEFQLLDDGGNLVRAATLAGGSETTSWAFPEELERDTPYRWRARAVLGNLFGPWSTTARFLTVLEKRAADPPPGQRLPFPGWGEAIVHRVAAQRPDLVARSCQEHGGTWEFMDLLVDTLRLEDSRFGYNGKRGNVNDPSLDVVAYHHGPGPDENSTAVYIIDVLLGHCGPSPFPAWIDQTGLTASQGTIGRWTSRGRF
jgi:hypothetical protein